MMQRYWFKLIVCIAAISVWRTALADSANLVLTMPLSQLEQAGVVSGLASRSSGSTLFASSWDIPNQAAYFQRNYRTVWMTSSLNERILLAERIGIQGRARYAAERGWTKLLGSKNRAIPQGPDSAYWDAMSGKVRVIEAKGGFSPLKISYGFPQGTNANTIRSAEFTLKSNIASEAEQLQAARIIRAAQRGRLATGATRTEHIWGTPRDPEMIGRWDTNNVSQDAFAIEEKLIRERPKLASTFEAAGKAQSADVFWARASKGVAGLGVLGSAGLAWDAYQQSWAAWTMWHDPVLRHTAMPYLQSGAAIGRWGEAITLGFGSAAQLGWLGNGGLSLLGQGAGKWFLPVALGVEAFDVGFAYYKYSHGMMSQRDFNRTLQGSGTFFACTAVGAGIGVWFGGVGVAPGAGIGAIVGAVAEGVEKIHWYFVDKHFTEKQQLAVDRAVEAHYGLGHLQ
ncbi:MAG: hypothetical protein GC164_14075 [Phycisphaera sp.]|nr:hypothetical protein [Phycisphaera sp.]